MAKAKQQSKFSSKTEGQLCLLHLEVCFRNFSSKYILFPIFHVYSIWAYSHHTQHWVPAHKITVKPTTLNRETQMKFIVLLKELLMAINQHTIDLAVKLSVMGVQKRCTKRRLTTEC